MIKIIVEEKSKSVLFKIKDTGIGITYDEIDKIFHRFFRTNEVRDKSVPGTGLGLAIVKHIIEAHNSKIVVKSKLGIGTEFLFELKKT
ncbi:MAG: sensor histidine kinase [Ignavibacteriae bacterium]|nr:sensor histidine kinase [Ignavibacteriota bacterium]